MKIRCATTKLIRMRGTSRPVDHTHSFRERRARRRGRPGPIDVSCALPPVRQAAGQLWISSLSLACPCPHNCYFSFFFFFFFFFLSTERIDASYFKAPLATSKSRQTTSEDAWALFISRCRYADNEYSNQFNISFAIVDIKCV